MRKKIGKSEASAQAHGFYLAFKIKAAALNPPLHESVPAVNRLKLLHVTAPVPNESRQRAAESHVTSLSSVTSSAAGCIGDVPDVPARRDAQEPCGC